MGCVSDNSSNQRVTAFPMKDLTSSGKMTGHIQIEDAPVRYIYFLPFQKFLFLIVLAFVGSQTTFWTVPFGRYCINCRSDCRNSISAHRNVKKAEVLIYSFPMHHVPTQCTRIITILFMFLLVYRFIVFFINCSVDSIT